MNNIQNGTYLGFSSEQEMNFYKKNHTQIQKFVNYNYTEEQLQKIQTLISETFPEIADQAKIVEALKDNILFKAKLTHLTHQE